MADSTLKEYAGRAADAIRGAVNSPTGKRIAEDVGYMTGGRAVQGIAENVAKRIKKRTAKNRDRSRE